MNVCVQGLWHLGSVIAAGLASRGHSVTGLEFDRATVDRLNEGMPPVFEPGLEDVVKQGLASGSLRFASNPETALDAIEVLWVAYDTPVDDDDNADAEYVLDRVVRVIPHLPVGVTVVISSQLPVGSVRRLETVVQNRFAEKDLGFVCSPENLRLGKALEVFLDPDRIIVGARSARDRARIDRLLRSLTNRIEWMSVESAEMTKHAINAFLATSVTFANEIAALCERTGADAKEVERGLKSEGRIGPKAYLSPGAAFAGGTLARDVAFLKHIGTEKQLEVPLLSSIKPSNDYHKHWVRRRLRSFFTDLARIRVAVWGLTYKPGTDTLRRSMAVELCNWLIDQNAVVCVHDPSAKSLPREWAGKVERVERPLLAVRGAEALVICTEWPQYREIGGEEIVDLAHGIAVLDANRFVAHLAATSGLRYVAVGMPEGLA